MSRSGDSVNDSDPMVPNAPAVDATEPGGAAPDTPAVEPKAEGPRGKAGKAKRSEQPLVDPTLATYFGEKPVPPGVFVKSVKTAKVGRFADEDLAEASRLAEQNDPNGARLLSLATQPGLPKVIDRWVWQATIAFLKSKVPGAFEPFDPDADATFRRVHRDLAPGLVSGDQQLRQRSETLLLLTLAWLGTQRSLDMVGALDILRDTFPGSEASLREAVRKGLVTGKLSDVKRAAAIATLLGRGLRDARATLDMERQRRAALESRLAEAQARIAEVSGERDALARERDALAAERDALIRQLEESRQHFGHDMVNVKAQQSLLLTERIAPLLDNAVDALEIQPPAPDVALRRLKSAIKSIQEAAQ